MLEERFSIMLPARAAVLANSFAVAPRGEDFQV
jgi:hypothetical protein